MLDNTTPSPKSPATKVTAKRIAKPPVNDAAAVDVAALGSRIAAQLKTMRSYEVKAREKAGVELRKAQDNFDTITQLLAEAKAKCDGAGFKAFKKRYCPNLSRSRVYELLAIGSGKTTIEESRAATSARVANHRRQAFDRLERVETSVTDDVTDKPPVEPPPAAISNVSSKAPAPITVNGAEPEAKPVHDEVAELLLDAICPSEGAGAAGLAAAIERDWREAERALEALTAHTVAQVAQAIPPGRVALVTEIAGYFTALAAKLTYPIPDDGSLPDCLRRGVS
jgi:hypothetical protein